MLNLYTGHTIVYSAVQTVPTDVSMLCTCEQNKHTEQSVTWLFIPKLMLYNNAAEMTFAVYESSCNGFNSIAAYLDTIQYHQSW